MRIVDDARTSFVYQPFHRSKLHLYLSCELEVAYQFHTVQSIASLHVEQQSEAELALRATVDRKSLP